MKKFTILVLLIFGIKSNAQWIITNQPPLTANGTLKSLFFINENMGFVGGTLNSTIPVLNKTVDGGQTWSVVNIQFYNCTTIKSIFFTDSNNGFITTDNNDRSYKTVDGGNTWQFINCQTYYPGKVYFKNNLIGFNYSDVSSSQNFSYTTDGGINWSAYSIPFGQITSIHFPNSSSNIGYMMLNYGRVYKTIDNGLNWNIVNNGSNLSFYSSIYFIDESLGFRVSYGNLTSLLEKTINGGVNWTVITQIPGKKILFTNSTTAYVSGYQQYQNSNEIYKIPFQSSYNSPQYILMTGTNSPISNSQHILDFQFSSSNIGYAISSNNKVYKINEQLGVSENKQSKIAIFPNPTNSILNISNSDSNDKNYFIHDLTGKIVSKGSIKNQQIKVDELQSGVYLLKIGNNLKGIKFKKD
jgi:hypothetical protein